MHVIDGSGLSPGFVSGVTDFDAYIATNPTHTYLYHGFEWSSVLGVQTALMNFDLGGEYQVSRVALWNEEVYGLTHVEVYACSDMGCAIGSLIGSFNPVDTPDDMDYGAQVFSLTSATTRYLMFYVIGPQGNQPNYDHMALGEVAFAVSPTAAAVPEPTTLLLLATGLPLIRRAAPARGRSASRARREWR